jgi:hypothetical protein
VEGVVLLLSYLIKKTRITTNTIAPTTPLIPPAIWPILLVWGSCGGDCTTTILPDKEDKDYYQHYQQYYFSEALVEGVVLLLSYLIKRKRITTNTIATTTPPIPPAIGSILLIWDSNVLLPSYLIKKCIISPVWGSSREDCTTTIYLIKMIRITTNTINTATPPMPSPIGSMLLVWGSGVERIVLLLSYLIQMTRITINTIANITPPIPPAIGAIVLVWSSSGEDCTTTILPDKDD